MAASPPDNVNAVFSSPRSKRRVGLALPTDQGVHNPPEVHGSVGEPRTPGTLELGPAYTQLERDDARRADELDAEEFEWYEFLSDEDLEDQTFESFYVDDMVSTQSEAGMASTQSAVNASDLNEGVGAVQWQDVTSSKPQLDLSLAASIAALDDLRDEAERLSDPRHPDYMGLWSTMSLVVEQASRVANGYFPCFEFRTRRATPHVLRDPPAVYTTGLDVRGALAHITADDAFHWLCCCRAELMAIATYTPAQKPVVRRLVECVKRLCWELETSDDVAQRCSELIGHAAFLAFALQVSSLLVCGYTAHVQHSYVAFYWGKAA